MQKAAIDEKMAQYDIMQQELLQLREQVGHAHEVHSQVQQMFNQGILKQNQSGNIEVVSDPNESEQIRSSLAEQSKVKPTNIQELQDLNQELDKLS